MLNTHPSTLMSGLFSLSYHDRGRLRQTKKLLLDFRSGSPLVRSRFLIRAFTDSISCFRPVYSTLNSGNNTQIRFNSQLKYPLIGSSFHLIVCVCVFSSHPFWTSSSLDVPAGVTQEEGHTGFLIHLPSAVRALIFVARRIQPFLSLVDREVEFCVLTN